MAELSPELGGGILGGLIAAFVLMLQWAKDRFGKPATNQALDLASKSMELFAEFKESIDALKDAAIAQTQELLSTRTAAAIRDEAIVAALVSLKDSSTSQHDTALTAILDIAPKITELTQAQMAKTEQSEGLQTVMNKAVTSQAQNYEEILAVLLRIEAEVIGLKTETAERVEKIEQDVNAIKADLVKPEPPPVAKPEFIAPIAPKPKTESEEKSDV